MDHLTKGTTKLIETLGDRLEIRTQYVSDRLAGVGSSRLLLKYSEGLFEGAKIQIRDQDYLIEAVDGLFLELSPPLSIVLPRNSPLFTQYETKGLPVSRAEYSQQLRLPADAVVISGSTVAWAKQHFFVLSVHSWSSSKAIFLREINASIDLFRLDGMEEIPLLFDLPASLVHNTTDLSLRESIGYLSTGTFHGLVAKAAVGDILLGDLLKYNNTKYKVVGLDEISYKNLINLRLSYESP